MKVIYKADDGTIFDEKIRCEQYEASQTIEAILSDLHESEVKAAMNYETDHPSALKIGAAIEKAARIIALARIAAGDAKRKTKPKAIPAAPTPAEIEKAVEKLSEFPTKENPFPSRKSA